MSTAIFLAVRYGKPGAPAWLTALQLAEKGWGHPEDIMRRRGSIKWAARWAAYQEQVQKSRKMDES